MLEEPLQGLKPLTVGGKTGEPAYIGCSSLFLARFIGLAGHSPPIYGRRVARSPYLSTAKRVNLLKPWASNAVYMYRNMEKRD